MKINVEIITKPLDLNSYAEGIDQMLDVWINPHPRHIAKYADIAENFDDNPKALAEWLSVLLSKGDAERSISVDEALELIESTKETDFIFWLIGQIFDLIAEHRKKK